MVSRVADPELVFEKGSDLEPDLVFFMGRSGTS